jgi:hypothetical protein
LIRRPINVLITARSILLRMRNDTENL